MAFCEQPQSRTGDRSVRMTASRPAYSSDWYQTQCAPCLVGLSEKLFEKKNYYQLHTAYCEYATKCAEIAYQFDNNVFVRDNLCNLWQLLAKPVCWVLTEQHTLQLGAICRTRCEADQSWWERMRLVSFVFLWRDHVRLFVAYIRNSVISGNIA